MSQPAFKANELIKALKNHGFKVVRQKGSHVRLRHDDGRVTSVPTHSGQDIGKGLLRKILRDTELTRDDIFKGIEE
jgi:predicted RNA binding protein YcfA (HicA-like mRNA interferase family)